MPNQEIPIWLIIVIAVIVPMISNFIANRGGYRFRMAQALMGEASAAEIIQRTARKQLQDQNKEHRRQLKEQEKRILALERSDAVKNKKINGLETELVYERSRRREVERGVGILSRQLSASGIPTEWKPPAPRMAGKK